MSTSLSSTQPPVPLRLRIDREATSRPHGAWWPRSRTLTTELGDLIDHFPAAEGRIGRVLVSRPDWDDAVTADGHGVRRVRTGRGMVKVGSFPHDDTHEVVLVMASGEQLHLTIVPSDTDPEDGARRVAGDGR